MDKINIKKVKVSNRLRETNEAAVKELAQSIYEIGLLHPITIDVKNNLVAGAHRLAAYTLLAEKYPEDSRWTEIPYTHPEGGNISSAEKRKIELEENLKRTQMTWQERSLGLLEYHRLAITSAAKKGEKWSERQTASLFGVSNTHFNSLRRIAERLKKNKDDPMWKLESPTDAIKLLFEEQKQKTTKKLAELNKKYSQTPLTPEGGESETSQPVSLSPTGDLVIGTPDFGTAPNPSSTPVRLPHIDWHTVYHQGDCLELMKQFAGKFDHIITDSPYGIDMDNFMLEDSIKNVREEHKVDDNLDLMKKFFKVAFETSQDYSFLCVWYDIMHHEKLSQWATDAGWTVCRWPFTWCKTSSCINRAAQYNITKATEHCLIMRKSKKSILAKKQDKNFILAARDKVSKEHPFGKPEAVWKYLIETVSVEGQTILDPFAGCGSSLLPILKLNRKPLAFEIKEEHIVNGIEWLESKTKWNTKKK